MVLSTLTTAPVLAASASTDGDISNFGLLFLLSGFVYYALMYFRYRNSNKRHHHESETRAEMHDLRADDQFHRSLKGVSNRYMNGANNNQVRGSLRGRSALDRAGISGLMRGRLG